MMRGWSLGLVGLVVAAGSVLADDEGKEAFLAAKCERCHGVAAVDIVATATSDRMRGPDLSRVGAEHDAEWILRFLNQEVEVEGKQHRTEWKGSKKDLERVVQWLAGLKGEAADSP